MSAPRVLVVYKKSTYQRYVQRGESRRIESLIAARDPSVRQMKRGHDQHLATIADAKTAFRALGIKASFRNLRSKASGDDFDLVVTLGGDGTLLWASHLVGSSTPMLAINTAPETSIGYFCAGDREHLHDIFRAALAHDLKATELTRMQVVVDGRTISERVLNDVLFSASCPAATTRYVAYFRGVQEDQKSSGVWMGPAAGSTAAQRSAGGRVLPIGSRRLQFVVREPYHGDHKPYELVKGIVGEDEEFRLKSKIPDARLWLDGPHREHAATLGSEITMRRSPQPLHLLGLKRNNNRTTPEWRDEPT